jgi:hypothetical protein
MVTPSVRAVCDATVATPATRPGSVAATVKHGLPPNDQPTRINRVEENSTAR